jgi:hypothetical protein
MEYDDEFECECQCLRECTSACLCQFVIESIVPDKLLSITLLSLYLKETYYHQQKRPTIINNREHRS